MSNGKKNLGFWGQNNLMFGPVQTTGLHSYAPKNTGIEDTSVHNMTPNVSSAEAAKVRDKFDATYMQSTSTPASIPGVPVMAPPSNPATISEAPSRLTQAWRNFKQNPFVKDIFNTAAFIAPVPILKAAQALNIGKKLEKVATLGATAKVVKNVDKVVNTTKKVSKIDDIYAPARARAANPSTLTDAEKAAYSVRQSEYLSQQLTQREFGSASRRLQKTHQKAVAEFTQKQKTHFYGKKVVKPWWLGF